MTLRTALAAVAVSAAFGSLAFASERTDVTPPLYREQARATAGARPAAELATVPRIVPAATDRPAPVLAAAAGAR